MMLLLLLLLLPQQVGNLNHGLGGGGNARGEQSDIRHEVVRECNVGVVNVPVTVSRGMDEMDVTCAQVCQGIPQQLGVSSVIPSVRCSN